MLKSYVFKSGSTDIYENLAMETWILDNTEQDSAVLYLWQNAPSVIIGRYQNPWAECNIEEIKKDGVRLARRKSGGGAVYHDFGNLCFTLILPRSVYSKEIAFSLLLSGLAKCGVSAELSGRNDILVAGGKVSGSAFEYTRTRVCHHGTMLFSIDADAMTRYLNPPAAKLESHGVKSVRSRVNSIPASLPDFSAALIGEFEKAFGKAQFRSVDQKQLESYESFFSDEKWIYGNTPVFTDRRMFKKGKRAVEICVKAENGCIQECTVYTDSLDAQSVEDIIASLKGSPYDSRLIEREADLFFQKSESEDDSSS